MEDKLVLGGKEFSSRFILGSGKYNINLIKAAVEQGGAEIITLALRRANTQEKENILDHIPEGVTLLPNTSGARNAEEAVRIARLSRAMGCGDFVKVEIMRDTKYLFPDNYETVKATETLAKEGFIVLPYMNPDLNVARDLQSAGAAAVMPLAAPIGSNKGLATKAMIQVLIDEIDLPIIVDAGIGKPSQACEAMEMGAAAVMANTAIATAGDVPAMANAFKLAIEAGRKAYLTGWIFRGCSKCSCSRKSSGSIITTGIPECKRAALHCLCMSWTAGRFLSYNKYRRDKTCIELHLSGKKLICRFPPE